MKLGIIIPIYNRLEITKAGLTDLKNHLAAYHEQAQAGDIGFEIIIVDDGSTDGSSEWIKANHPDVHVLFGDGNLWWTGAMDMGARYSINDLKTDFILMWNDDVFTENSYFTEVNKLLKDDKELSTVYGSYVYEYPSVDKIWSKGGHFNKYFGIRRMYRDRKRDRTIKQTYWFTGMGTIMSSVVLKKLDFFDYKIFAHYHGDTDITLRAYEQGFKMMPCPQLKIWNRVEHSSFIPTKSWSDYFKSLRITQSRYNIKNEVIFLRRHSVTPLWVIYLLKKQTDHFIGFIKSKYIKKR